MESLGSHRVRQRHGYSPEELEAMARGRYEREAPDVVGKAALEEALNGTEIYDDEVPTSQDHPPAYDLPHLRAVHAEPGLQNRLHRRNCVM